jgi:hypothetical protein
MALLRANVPARGRGHLHTTVTVTDNLGQTGKVSFTWVIAGA